ncbi:MAG: anti-sigma factor family protein [Candidatus Binatia bacterium]
MNCQEYRELVTPHVDGALLPMEKREVQSHVDRCPKCMQMFLWETGVKKILRNKFSRVPVRPGLKERLLDQLGQTKKRRFFDWSFGTYGLAAAVALLFVVIVPYMLRRNEVQNEIQKGIFTNTISQYQTVARGIANTSPVAIAQTPTARLLDLSPWGYRLLARQIKNVEGQEDRVFVYQGPGKKYLLAQEFDGVKLLPPDNARVIRISNREFVSFNREHVNLIAWKEKSMVCVLASSLPKDQLLDLAKQIVIGA